MSLKLPFVAVLLASVLLGELASAQNPPDKFLVNFQPSWTEPCSGFNAIDVGEPFGPKKHGLLYGWLAARGLPMPLDMQPYAYRAGNDTRACGLRSSISMQPSSTCTENCTGIVHGKWVLQLRRGLYEVTVRIGDPEYWKKESLQAVTINGKTVVRNFVPHLGRRTVSVTTKIFVPSRRLWISAEQGGLNTKLLSIDVNRIASQPPPEGACRLAPSPFGNFAVSTLPCDNLRLRRLPFQLAYDGSQKGVPIFNGRSGFTGFLPSSRKPSYYDPSLLRFANSCMEFTAAEGTFFGKKNNVENAMMVGLPVPDFDVRVSVNVTIPETVTGQGERFCTFIAMDDKNYGSVCVISVWRFLEIVFVYEEDDEVIDKVKLKFDARDLPEDRSITLNVEALSLTNNLTASYQLSSQNESVFVGSAQAQPGIFSKDGAKVDFNAGTSSFGGVYASSGWSGKNLKKVFKLCNFTVERLPSTDDDVPVLKDVDFSSWFISNIEFPTATAADGNTLYVATAVGDIHIIELNTAATSVVSRRLVSPIGSRLILGLTIGPDSSPGKPVLWISHSDVAQQQATANAGVVTRVEGPIFGVEDATDYIVGLPRALFNHATNSLHFGPNGKLFLTVGGNTPGGAPSDYSTDFGQRAEQCFSAALLEADVFAPNFTGTCIPKQDPENLDKGIVSEDCENVCDVRPYATGLRNSVDFVFHSNGRLYATDNGTGGRSVPPEITPAYRKGDSCGGIVTGDKKEALDPGIRPDLFYDIEFGDYFGHPNPARKECVFYGGNPTTSRDSTIPESPVTRGKLISLQNTKYSVGVNPDPSFKKAMMSFDKGRSPNGVIEYKGNAFCGALKGDVIVLYYSQLDQMRRLKLSSDGKRVVQDSTLNGSTEKTGAPEDLKNPLAITQDSAGNMFVTEFFGSRVRVLNPKFVPC